MNKNSSMLSRNIYLSLLAAIVAYVIFTLATSAFIINSSMNEFKLLTMSIENNKQKTLMLAMLTESEIRNSQSKDAKSISRSLTRNFDDYVYAADEKELSVYEAIARKVMHQTLGDLSYSNDSGHENERNFLYYRSYTGDKYISNRYIEGFTFTPELYSIQRCHHTKSCSLYAWPEQLIDNIIISSIYSDSITGANTMSVASPVRVDRKIVGEFVAHINPSKQIAAGKSIQTSTQGQYKYTTLTYQGYPLSDFAISRIYVADNSSILEFKYPISKLFIDDYWFIFVSFILFFSLNWSTSEAKSRKHQLEKAVSYAKRDELTGLYNRKIFRDIEFLDATNESNGIVIAIDGDRIKYINDKYGHHVGDHAIKTISSAMKQAFRSSDYLIRTGGDEFLAVLPGCTVERAVELTEKLKKDVSKMPVFSSNVFVTVSTGVSEKQKNEPFNDAIVRADEKLYQQKSAREST